VNADPPLDQEGHLVSDLRPIAAAPSILRTSFWLWIASAAVTFLAGIVGVIFAVQAGATGSSATAVLAGSVVGAIIGAGLRIVIAFFLVKGVNWARIILTIFGGLTVLTSLSSLFTGDLLGILVLALTVAAGITMWSPAASAYLRRRY
jgi:hypothetical protein